MKARRIGSIKFGHPPSQQIVGDGQIVDAPFVHILPKADACDHDFQGWRVWSIPGQGGGGEQVCTKCGMGAMDYTLRTGY